MQVEDKKKLRPASEWKFLPFKERAKETLVSSGVGLGYVLALSQIFNPAFLLLSVGLGVLTVKFDTQRLRSKGTTLFPGNFTDRSKDVCLDYFQRVVDSFSYALKIPQQKVLFLKREVVLGWLRPDKRRECEVSPELLERHMSRMAMASELTGEIALTREHIRNNSF